MKLPPTHPEIEAIRSRFDAAMVNGRVFAEWVGKHAIGDMLWLFGAIDGMLFWQWIEQEKAQASQASDDLDLDGDDEIPF